MEHIQKRIMRIIGYFIVLALFIVTILGVSAFELDDNEDIVVLSSGDSVVGSFIVKDYENINIKSDFKWLSFDKDSMLDEIINVDGNEITNGVMSIQYYISVPDNVGVGIYRTVIEVSDGFDTEYLNLKISVQKPFISVLANAYKHKSTTYLTYFIVGFLLLLSLTYLFARIKK